MDRKRRHECQSQQHELRARVFGRPAALSGSVPGLFPRAQRSAAAGTGDACVRPRQPLLH